MTLQQFRSETATLDGDTEILVLTPWGETETAAWVMRPDLEDSDPIRAEFPDNAILLTGEAD